MVIEAAARATSPRRGRAIDAKPIRRQNPDTALVGDWKRSMRRQAVRVNPDRLPVLARQAEPASVAF